MTGLLYLCCLVAGLAAMAVCDARWRLFVFAGRPGRAAATLAIGVGFFILWDTAGIATGVFFRGSGPYLTGVMLAREFPLEELFFLTFLCWLTMNLWVLLIRLLRHGRPGPGTARTTGATTGTATGTATSTMTALPSPPPPAAPADPRRGGAP